jgi:hypothetical protein
MLRMTLLLAVISVNGLALANYYFDPTYSREDARSTALFLQEVTRPQDSILVIGNTTALRYYYSGNVPIVTWSKEMIDEQSTLENHFHALSTHHNHVWLVQNRAWEPDPRGIVKAMFDAKLQLVEHKKFTGMDIYSYKK